MGLYYKKNKIAGLNFLPRLTLAQYNALTVKPEYWIRTDSPDSYLMVSSNLVSFDNSGTIFTSTNVKDTLKEISDILARNGKPRFKNLGTTFTEAQATAIANGDYSDLQAGDYWEDTIYNIKWQIVDDTEFYNARGRGLPDSPMVYHHLVVMPTNPIVVGSEEGPSLMNDTDTTAGGYYACKYRDDDDGMRTFCKAVFTSFFGASHIAKYTAELSNLVADGRVMASEWDYNCNVELPSAVNMCGHNINGTSLNIRLADNVGVADVPCTGGLNINQMHGQFSLFRNYPRGIMSENRQAYWLRDITSQTHFARVNWNGAIDNYNASYSNTGIRPFAFIV